MAKLLRQSIKTRLFLAILFPLIVIEGALFYLYNHHINEDFHADYEQIATTISSPFISSIESKLQNLDTQHDKIDFLEIYADLKGSIEFPLWIKEYSTLSEVLLIDSGGGLLSGTTSLAGLTDIEQLQNELEIVPLRQIVSLRQNRHFLVAIPLKSDNVSLASLLLKFTDSEIASLEREAMLLALLTLALSLLFASLMAWILSTAITRPINRLAFDSQRLATGDLDHAISAPRQRDEIGMLAQNFQLMRDSIREKILALSERERNFRELFENTEASIWNEDLSQVYAELTRLRRDGVLDLREYLREKPQAAWEMARMVRVLQVNQSTLRLFGARNQEEMLAQIDKTFGDKAIETFIDELCAIWDKRDTFRAEAPFRTLSGIDFEAIISFHIPDRAEGFSSIPVTIIDISERKQAERAMRESEARFREIFTSNPDPVILATLESGAIVDVNPSFVAATGISKTEALGHNSEDLGLWNDVELRSSFREKLLERGEVNNLEADFRVKGGDVRTGLVSARVLDIGHASHILLVIRDITTEKDAERALMEMNRLKNEFISTAAHELNTPLTVMMGFTELLRTPEDYGGFTEQQTREFLKEIYDRGESLSRIITDLLDISRIESGQPVTLHRAETDLPELLRKAVENYRHLDRTHHYLLELPEASQAELISIDSHRINQVMENLLSNAAKYSPEDTEVIIRGSVTEEFWEIQIIDKGIGLTPEQRERIFDKFYRADSSNTAVGGLGLGMSIAKQIIEEHGGSIRVKSSPGKGTDMTFTLPR